MAQDGRHVLRGRDLASTALGGDSTRRELGTTPEIVAALRDVFGLQVDATLAAALSAQTGGSERSAARS